MKQIAQNSFNKGLIKDLNPLTTPNDVLTDALNATIITYNGNEFVLQNDMGNCKVERAKLSPGFIPVGMNEYGGIVYVASHNPETGENEIGSFPSPERDFSTTDFANISPANFKTSDFVVSQLGTEVEKLTKVQKLSEPELLQLNPGDKYIVVYNIKDTEAGNLPDEIDSTTRMDQWMSKSDVNRKLFKLKFYKVADSNLVELDSSTIATMPDGVIDDTDYKYFTETSKATLAVGIELESLDIFDSNVIDTSTRTDPDKKFVIEAVGYSNSTNKFKGVKVDLTNPTAQTFYIEKAAGVTTNKVAAELSGLAAKAQVKGKITPYSDYGLFPKLMQTFDFKLASAVSGGTSTTNIYKFQKVGKFMRIEFDYKFEGDTGVDLYLEFYDPWSDYSTISIIDSPTYYGLNTAVVELVDEPRTTNPDGGTKVTELTNVVDPYFKHVLSTSGMVRKNQLLRDNHFYIVRIVGVEKVKVAGVDTTKYYDVYRPLYTSDMFNAEYADSVNWDINDPKQDFNNLPFKYTDIAFDLAFDKRILSDTIEKDVTSDTDFISDAENYQQFLQQDNKKIYGMITEDSNYIASNGSNILYGTKYSKKAKDVLKVIPKVTKIFGNLKETGLVVNVTKTDTKTVDEGYNANLNLSTDSAYDLTITKVNDKYYNLDHELKTYRKLKSTPLRFGTVPGNLAGNSTGRLPLALPMLKQSNGGNILSVNVHEYISSRYLKISGTANNNIYYDWTGPANSIDDAAAYSALLTFEGSTIKPSSYFARFTGETNRITDNTCCEDTSRDRNSVYNQFSGGFAVLKTKDNKTLIWNKNVSTIEKFMNSVEIGYQHYENLYVYTANPETTVKHAEIKTVGTHQLSVDVNLQSTNSLFNFPFKAKGTTNDFMAAVFNDYITERSTGNTVLEGVLKPQFFPIEDIDESFDKVLDSVQITSEFEDTLSQPIITAQQDILKLSIFDTGSNSDVHGQIYIKQGSPSFYTELANYFEVRPAFFAGTTAQAVQSDQVHLVLKDDIKSRDFMLKYGGNWGKDKLFHDSHVINEIQEPTLINII